MTVKAADAKYILGEIRNIQYYQMRIAVLTSELFDLDKRIETATDPVSPNGGNDVTVNGKSVRVKIHGSGAYDSGSAIAGIITAQKPIEDQLRDFKRRYETAVKYRSMLMKCEESGFIQEFISGTPYRELQKKYFTSNPYDKMIRLIIQYVKNV